MLCGGHQVCGEDVVPPARLLDAVRASSRPEAGRYGVPRCEKLKMTIRNVMTFSDQTHPDGAGPRGPPVTVNRVSEGGCVGSSSLEREERDY